MNVTKYDVLLGGKHGTINLFSFYELKFSLLIRSLTIYYDMYNIRTVVAREASVRLTRHVVGLIPTRGNEYSIF